jgi:heat shock protein HslJ
MKKALVLISLVIVAALIFSGCQGGGSKITDTVWEWEKFESGDGSTITVDDPENYTLLLKKDGSVAIKADCNSVLGEYTMEDASLKITLGPTTLAFCGEESLDTQYLGYLENVATYVLDGGTLYLNLMYDSGNMIFRSGGAG